MPIDSWESLWSSYEDFKRALTSSKALTVNASALRAQAKAVVQQYFRETRADLVLLGVDLNECDSLMQRLLRLANGRNAKATYVQTLRSIGRVKQAMEVRREIAIGTRSFAPDSRSAAASALTDIEGRIAGTLDQLLPSAALSYKQALADLASGRRFSYRGIALELRETLREVLDHLAPDAEVMKTSGFALEKGAHGPTMKQKAKFVLRARGATGGALATAEEGVGIVQEATASLTRSVYQRGSASTHVATSEGEVRRLKPYVDAVLADLLETRTQE